MGVWSGLAGAAGLAGSGGGSAGAGAGGQPEAGRSGEGGRAGVAGLGGSGVGGVAGAGSGGDTGGDGASGEGGNAAGGDAGGAAGVGACGVVEPERPVTAPLAIPWETSFEDDVCDYVRADGFCYVDGDASYEVVVSPTHSGDAAVALSVNSAEGSSQVRCVREGTLPPDAIYGAWFYVPALAEMTGLWNLFFFQGYNGVDLEELWDVSIGTNEAGTQGLFVFDHRAGQVTRPPDGRAIPVGAWFHVEFRMRRAGDASGLVQLYQDGELLLERAGPTDDTSWGQWYVGNLATERIPPDSTLYIDDVSIRAP